jgi:hypothetical protein
LPDKLLHYVDSVAAEDDAVVVGRLDDHAVVALARIDGNAKKG